LIKIMEKRFLNIKEMSDYIGLTQGTLYVWTSQRRLPYLKVGNRVRFDLQEIEKWLKGKRIKDLT